MIQVYTGNGKGKTTAAFGLALRAAGAGLNVYIGQFVKGRSYSEVKILNKIRNIKLEQFGRKCFIRKLPEKIDIAMACAGLERINQVLSSKKFNLIILDEINIAIKLKLIPLESVLETIKLASKNIELVLTGRDAHLKVIDLADLVSDIKDIKHYYNKGQRARKGIEF